MDAAGNNEIGEVKGGSNETNLSNSFVSKKFTKQSYLTSEGAKKGDGNTNNGGGNIKKSVKAARAFNYQTLNVKKAFNILWHAFIQAPIL